MKKYIFCIFVVVLTTHTQAQESLYQTNYSSDSFFVFGKDFKYKEMVTYNYFEVDTLTQNVVVYSRVEELWKTYNEWAEHCFLVTKYAQKNASMHYRNDYEVYRFWNENEEVKISGYKMSFLAHFERIYPQNFNCEIVYKDNHYQVVQVHESNSCFVILDDGWYHMILKNKPNWHYIYK